jgi:hypothetical protein
VPLTQGIDATPDMFMVSPVTFQAEGKTNMSCSPLAIAAVGTAHSLPSAVDGKLSSQEPVAEVRTADHPLEVG